MTISLPVPRLAVILIASIVIVLLGFNPNTNASAATSVVLVGQASNGAPAQRYNPASVTIATGDTVRWDWFNGTHDVQAYDGSFSSGPIGGISKSGDTFSRVFSTPGTYTYYCDVHAGPSDADPSRIDERIAQGKMVGKIVVTASDTSGPVTSNVSAIPNPSSGAAAVTLTASIADAGSVVSNITAAEYFIGAAGANGTGTAMSPSDGAFNSPAEQVTATVDISALPVGDHQLNVRGRDAAGNWGLTAATTLSVTAAPVGNEVALLVILAGSLSNTTQPVDFGAVNLTGADQTLNASPAAWRASDGTGTGAGWNVSLTASDLTSPGGAIPAANLKIQQLQAKILTVSGGAGPVTQVPGYVSVNTVTPLKLLSAAAGTGMGTYDYTPDFRLLIPASSAPGDYSSSLVVSINAGP